MEKHEPLKETKTYQKKQEQQLATANKVKKIHINIRRIKWLVIYFYAN